MTRGKTDKVDAARIAWYGYKNQECAKIWTPKREILQELGSKTICESENFFTHAEK